MLPTGPAITAFASTTDGEFVSPGKITEHTKRRSLITTEETMPSKKQQLDPIHPGEILEEDFI